MIRNGTGRAYHSPTMLGEILNDLRFGARKLTRSPGFTLVAVAMLALGIGANAAIFSFIDAILLKTLPVADPARLVVFGEGGAGVTGSGDMPQTDSFSYQQLQAFELRKDIFSHVAASPTFISTVAVGDSEPGVPLTMHWGNSSAVSTSKCGVSRRSPGVGSPRRTICPPTTATWSCSATATG